MRYPAHNGPTSLMMIGLAVVVAMPAQAIGQQVERAVETTVVASDAVPAGEIRGVVVDAVSGKPVEHAFVAAIGLANAQTDSLGRFTLSGVVLPTRLVAETLDQRRTVFQLPADSTTGWVAVLTLGPARLCEGGASYGIVLEVRDALTGVAPLVAATARVTQDTIVAERSETGTVDDDYLHLHVPIGPQWFGPHRRSSAPISVVLHAEGYLPWSRDGIHLSPGYCGEAVKTFPVWLLRTDAVEAAAPSNKR